MTLVLGLKSNFKNEVKETARRLPLSKLIGHTYDIMIQEKKFLQI
jgi:hypothetical protein